MSGRPGKRVAASDADEARFEQVYEHCYPAIHAYCARRLRPHAVDDAVAETFVVAWRRVDEVPAGREALFWLYRVAARVVGHHWRGASRRRRLATRLRGTRVPTPRGPDDRAVADEECRIMLDALNHLRPDEAELLRLVAWEQLTTADLAHVLDVTPNTASQRLSRARKHLTSEFDRLARRPDRSPAALNGGER